MISALASLEVPSYYSRQYRILSPGCLFLQSHYHCSGLLGLFSSLDPLLKRAPFFLEEITLQLQALSLEVFTLTYGLVVL